MEAYSLLLAWRTGRHGRQAHSKPHEPVPADTGRGHPVGRAGPSKPKRTYCRERERYNGRGVADQGRPQRIDRVSSCGSTRCQRRQTRLEQRLLLPTKRKPILYNILTFNFTEDSSAWYCDDVFFSVLKRHVKTYGGAGLSNDSILERQQSSAESANISFHLFTRQNPSTSQRLIPTVESLNGSFFNGSRPTRVIVHGFCNCQHSNFCQTVKDALLYANDVNIITIDWSDTAGVLEYILLRLRLDQVAVSLAGFVDFLHNTTDLQLDDLHLIGHSLGAHLAGLSGKRVTSGRVGAILGLDPAGPLFSSSEPRTRLASTDAQYVEVIHTNGGTLGMYDPIGTADFYPNGGKHQPGCLPWIFGMSCSHGRAWELYAESVYTPVGFKAVPCDSVQQIEGSVCRIDLPKMDMGGEPVNKTKSGLFVLSTNSRFPYAKG
uniref:Lipase domain-containing protein n=1 Tax=Anopheles dirus TaxID=7168 RepID=A0A182NSI6_9DIPT